MRGGLRRRLILAIVLITFGASAIVGVALGRFTQNEFRQFLEVEMEVGPRAAPDLTTLFAPLREGDREGAREALLALDPPDRIVVFSPGGELIADSDPRDDSPRLVDGDLELSTRRQGNPDAEERLRLRGSIPIGGTEHPLGLAFVIPALDASERASPGAGFTRRIGTAQLVGVIVVTLLALTVALLLSRQILGPVEKLTGAAQRLAEGDLTQRVEVTSGDEIGELARAFNSMASSLERQEAARRNMASDVAHELRTPLTHLRCRLESVQDGLLRPDQPLIHELHGEIVHLARLVDDLQELSLAEAGRLPLYPTEVSLAEVVPGVIASLPSGSGRPRVTIEGDPADLPDVTVDVDRFRQVLRNLLDNAVRHGRPDGRVTVGFAVADGEVELSVTDDGPGIPDEQQELIFRRFHRTDASRARSTGGVGLGLAIVRELVRGWGGRLGVENVPGGGTRFRFTVPPGAGSR